MDMASAVTTFPAISILSGVSAGLYLVALFPDGLRWQVLCGGERIGRDNIRATPVFLDGAALSLARLVQIISMTRQALSSLSRNIWANCCILVGHACIVDAVLHTAKRNLGWHPVLQHAHFV